LYYSCHSFTVYQSCPLLANDFGQNQRKNSPTHLFVEATFQRFLPQNSSKNVKYRDTANNQAFFVNITRQKVRPFFEESAKKPPQIFPAAKIFMMPLLCFAAEISASWQHCYTYLAAGTNP
jgi:hypothetical protein